MKFDCVVIGGGLAGLTCGLRLAQAGKRCAIVSTGQSALHFSSGSFDLLNALPDGTPVEAPLQALEALAAQAPEHPYAKLGSRVETLAAEAAQLLTAAGVAVTGSAARNHYRLTPMGELKPTWLTMESYLHGDAADKLPWSKVTLFNAAGYLDFYPAFIADQLQRYGCTCEVRSFNFPALETLRTNPTEMRSANIARLFDNDEHLETLAKELAQADAASEAILLPALLGLQRKGVAEALSKRLGKPVVTVATLPPSVPGIQAQLQLRRAFEQAGGTFLPGDTAVSYEEKGNRITALHTAHQGDIALEADHYVLATGSYFSRGLAATQHRISEPLFEIDVTQAESRDAWYDADLFAKQPFAGFGVKTDSDFHALRNGEPIANLYVAGAILDGFDPMREGCGGGVSMLTALRAAELILS